jgi:hypothetical protein
MCEAERMTCPLCRQRKSRRDCPALRQSICPVCCGTKRLVEIDCPEDCVHLASARVHPAAVVRRQQEQDVGILAPTIRHLTERQRQLFFLLQSVILRHTPDGLARLLDEDVAEATGAMAKTIETAQRGVIYEHAPQTLPAQKLAGEMKAMLAEVRQSGATIYDGELAITLRAIEAGAREVGTPGGAEYQALMRRLLQVRMKEGEERSALILP